jgi:hypothetical protein
MNISLQNQVSNLELSKRLKDLGVKSQSLFAYYGNAGEWHDTIVDMDMYKNADDDFREHKLLPAYTVAELGEILINLFGKKKISLPANWQEKGRKWEWYCWQDDSTLCADTEADIRAKMLIHLLENKHMTL